MKHDLLTPEGLQLYVQILQRRMRENVERDGFLASVAAVVARRNPITGEPLPTAMPMLVPLDEEMQAAQEAADPQTAKDRVARTLARFARACDAHAVIIGMEAWQKTVMGQRIGEVIVCTVETRGDDKGQAYMSYIVRDADRVTTSDWDSWPMALQGVRFGGLLRDDYGQAPSKGTIDA